MTNPIATTAQSVDFNPNRGNRVWIEDDLFVPGGAGGRVVPNINDMVYKYEDNMIIFKRVVEVDYTTYASSLKIMAVWDVPEGEDIRDIILLGAPGRASSSRRLYVDRSVKPVTCSVDVRLWIAGTMARTIKLFRGTDTGPNGEVISCLYDQNNQLLGENIPLQVVATVDVPNEGSALVNGAAVKVVSVGNLSKEVTDNELVTMVVYNDTGGVVMVQELLVYNTSFSRRVDSSRKYITDIRLSTDFIDPQDDRRVLIPRLTTIESVLQYAEIVYSNGEIKRVPIDGQRVLLHGTYAQRYIANRDGVTASLVLTYMLDQNEFLYGSPVGANPHMSVKYTVETTPFEEVFSCRIWAVPMWEGNLVGYRMRYFLSTLRRDSLLEVTGLVRLSVNSQPFDPRLYGARQELILNLQMSEVLPIFQDWRYTQPIDIVLYGPGSDPGTNWTVNYKPGQATLFGLDNKAKGDYISAGNWKLDIAQNEPTAESWLTRIYRKTLPIHNPTSETVAPTPTHFKVTVPGGSAMEFSVDEYATQLTVLGSPQPGSTVLVEFIRRTGNGDLCLGIVGLPFVQVD